MASIVLLIRGALANALAFTGSSYLFHRLSADNIDAERKRHDAAIEALQKAQVEWYVFRSIKNPADNTPNDTRQSFSSFHT